MAKELGTLLCEYRKRAGLKQRELGQRVHLHGSMISRFETSRADPSPATLQAIVNALALCDMPRDELDQLWEAAGYPRNRIDEPLAHPIVLVMQQEFEKLDPEQQTVLNADLRSVIELEQEYFFARRASSQRNWLVATEGLESYRQRLERPVQSWYARADEELGWCKYGLGHYGEAVQHYEWALWSVRRLGDLRSEAQLLMRLGDAHRRRGGPDWNIAQDRYGDAKEILDQLGDMIRVADCVRKIAGVYLFRGRPDEALPLCVESLEIAEDAGYDLGRYKAMQHEAWAFDMLGRWREGTRLFEDALAIAREVSSDDWEIAKALRYLGDSYRLERRMQEAEDAYKQASEMLEKTQPAGPGALLYVGMIELGLGKLYMKQSGRTMEAKSCLNRSLEIHRNLGEDFRVAQVLCEQGDLLLRLGRFEEADMRLDLATSKLTGLGNMYDYCIGLVTQCELYYKTRDFGRLHRTAQTARDVDNNLVNYQLARIEFTEGQGYLAQKAVPQAADAFSRASERALDFNEESFRQVCRDILEEVERAGCDVSPEVGLQLCKSQIRFWLEKLATLEPPARRVVEVWLETIQLKRGELQALKPVE